MSNISKFQADVKLILKQDRQENNGKSDWTRVSSKLLKLFENSTHIAGVFPFMIFEYWENEYIQNSSHLQNEPTKEHLDKLCAMLSFLENTGKDYDPLDDYDWIKLRELVDTTITELPADVLESLRTTLISRGV